MTEQLTLRDRKKVETRDRLARAGFDLVVARGYHQVTTADIADAAGVSRRTFSNYFTSKADCIVQAHGGTGASLMPMIITDDSGAPPVRRIAKALGTLPEEFWTDLVALYRLTQAEPDVLAARARVQRSEIAGIIDAIDALGGAVGDRLRMVVTLSAVMACFDACIEHWISTGDTTDHAALAELIGQGLEAIDFSWAEQLLPALRHNLERLNATDPATPHPAARPVTRPLASHSPADHHR